MQDVLGADFIGCLFVYDIEQSCKMRLVSLSNSPGGKLASCPFACDIGENYKM